MRRIRRSIAERWQLGLTATGTELTRKLTLGRDGHALGQVQEQQCAKCWSELHRCQACGWLQARNPQNLYGGRKIENRI
jgi:hypothetical protein